LSAWSTESFATRQGELREPNLRALFPSQAWSLFRIAPKCASVLDLGFGSIDSLIVLRKINPQISYLGLDLESEIVSDASPYSDERTQFVCADFLGWEGARAELVQGWSFVYAHARPYECIERMYELADRFCLFDVRVTHLDADIVDTRRSRGMHDGREVPYPLLSWPRLRSFLESLSPSPAIELATYYFPPGPHVVLASDVPQPFVASLVLGKAGGPSFYGRVVEPLR
jgi:hypothetical protein